MKKKITIAIDAMGGSDAPYKNIEGIKIFLDKNKLNYLFNDLQESQSALNEICQMIVVRDSDGNALYDFPEGTIGTILTYYEKFIERKENENEF